MTQRSESKQEGAGGCTVNAVKKKKTLARQCEGFGGMGYREYLGRLEYRRPIVTECSKDKPIE